MAVPGEVTDVAGLCLAGLLAVTAGMTAWQVPRGMVISRRGGAIPCGLQAGAAALWRHGVVAYEGDKLCWYASPGLRLRPDARFGRARLRILASRPPTHAEVAEFGGAGLVIAECTADGQTAGLALSEPALTGLLAWLEAAPRYYLAPD